MVIGKTVLVLTGNLIGSHPPEASNSLVRVSSHSDVQSRSKVATRAKVPDSLDVQSLLHDKFRDATEKQDPNPVQSLLHDKFRDATEKQDPDPVKLVLPGVSAYAQKHVEKRLEVLKGLVAFAGEIADTYTDPSSSQAVINAQTVVEQAMINESAEDVARASDDDLLILIKGLIKWTEKGIDSWVVNAWHERLLSADDVNSFVDKAWEKLNVMDDVRGFNSFLEEVLECAGDRSDTSSSQTEVLTNLLNGLIQLSENLTKKMKDTRSQQRIVSHKISSDKPKTNSDLFLTIEKLIDDIRILLDSEPLRKNIVSKKSKEDVDQTLVEAWNNFVQNGDFMEFSNVLEELRSYVETEVKTNGGQSRTVPLQNVFDGVKLFAFDFEKQYGLEIKIRADVDDLPKQIDELLTGICESVKLFLPPAELCKQQLIAAWHHAINVENVSSFLIALEKFEQEFKTDEGRTVSLVDVFQSLSAFASHLTTSFGLECKIQVDNDLRTSIPNLFTCIHDFVKDYKLVLTAQDVKNILNYSLDEAKEKKSPDSFRNVLHELRAYVQKEGRTVDDRQNVLYGLIEFAIGRCHYFPNQVDDFCKNGGKKDVSDENAQDLERALLWCDKYIDAWVGQSGAEIVEKPVSDRVQERTGAELPAVDQRADASGSLNRKRAAQISVKDLEKANDQSFPDRVQERAETGSQDVAKDRSTAAPRIRKSNAKATLKKK